MNLTTSVKNRPQTDDGRPMLKMKELVESSGLPKSTIQHYVNEGLLPQPVRTGPNMAYYHPACLDRIAFIRQTQARHRLPLTIIKGLVKEYEQGREISPLLELQGAIFGGTGGRRLKKTAYCRATGLTEGQVDELVALRLILPLENGLFDQEDAAIGRFMKNGIDRGIDPKEWVFYPNYADRIIDREMEIREKATRDLAFEQDAELTLEMTRAARAMRSYVIDRLFQRRVMSLKGLKGDADAGESEFRRRIAKKQE